MVSSVKALMCYQHVNDHLGHKVDLDENSQFGTGDTVSKDDKVYSSIVGVDKLTKQLQISDTEFTAGLVSLYRENRHVEQVSMVHNDKSKYSLPIKLSYYASMACPDYTNKKTNKENYFNSPREVEAELFSVYSAYCISNNTFGKEKANKMMCDYVNERIASNDYFIKSKDGKPYEKMNDIIKDMADKYEESVNTKHVYKNKDCEKGVNVAKQVFDKNPDMSKAMARESVGWKSDWKLATVYLNQQDKQSLCEKSPGLSNVNFLYDAAFKIQGLGERLKNKFSHTKDAQQDRGQMANEILERMSKYNPYDQQKNNDTEYQ